MKEKVVKKRHIFSYWILRKIAFIYSRLFIGYRCKDKYKMKKGESIMVLSNHQTDADPFCILTSFSRPVYPIATDNIFSGRFRARLFSRLGVIPKKKGVIDLRTTLMMSKAIKEGGSLLLFPEGNRSYAEFQFYIADTLARYIKSMKVTLVLFTLHGGNGVSPRFKNKNRKGKFIGKIAKVLTYDEYKDIPDEKLDNLIKDTLKVFDSDSSNLYKSKRRGEYLERIFFVCPKCGKVSTLFSKNEYISCSSCGLKVEYGEDLHLHSDDKDFKFNKMIEWWNYQKRYISNLKINKGENIFSDEDIILRIDNPFKKKQVLYKGSVAINDTQLIFGDSIKLDLKDITIASIVSGRNLTFTIGEDNYTIRGNRRFNPLKYIFLFNKLDTAMHLKNTDKYYSLKED